MTHSGTPSPRERAVFVRERARRAVGVDQRTRELREDLTLEQILDMIVAIASIHGESGYLEPILQAALDGRRSPRG